jgi:hypothetical protein
MQDLVGDPPRCAFSDAQVFEHCPWDEKRNFNTFLNALAILFFVTTGDSSWTDTMHRGMRTNESPVVGVIFFMVFYMSSVYCICNLFICVILAAFEMEEEDKLKAQVQQYRTIMIKKVLKDLTAKHHRDARQTTSGEKKAQANELLEDEDHMENVHLEDDSDHDDQDEEVQEVEVLLCLPPPMPNKYHPDEPRNTRYFVRKLVRSRLYNWTVLGAIFTSAGLLACESRIKALSLVSSELVLYFDYAFYGIFLTEFVLKVLDTGIAFEGPDSYFRKGWNWLDFILLAAQSLDLFGVDGMKALRVLRVLRPLRSLRVLNKIEKLQLMIMAISQSAADVANVLFIWFFAYLIFGIIGMTLFQVRTYHISPENLSHITYPLISFQVRTYHISPIP